MHAIWKGSISFGLVTIPISLFSATRSEELKFRLLRKSDLSPINYKRVAEVDGKEVPWDQIVKGYEHEDGKYVVLKDEDFKRADVEATQTVDIIDFVELEDIDPVFFSKPFYMVPNKGGEKAYSLLGQVLKDTGKVGIAKVVIKTRQHLAAVKSRRHALVLEMMHFADEIAALDTFPIPKETKIAAKEMEMAKTLVKSMSEKWKPDKYHDDYRAALLKMIHAKIKSGGKEIPTKAEPKKRASNVIDLVEVLRRSIKETGKTEARKKKAAPVKKRAHRKAS
jgi:DNA end-binding protein Ku